MRLLFALLAAVFFPVAAAADVTARYGVRPDGPSAIVVEVNDRGDSRITFGNQMAYLTVDGATYVLLADLLGVFAVRQDDLRALREQVAAAMRREAFAEAGIPEPPSREADAETIYTAVQAGTETVAGRTGVRWVMGPSRDPRDGTHAADSFVVTDDPILAPIGRALAREFSEATESSFLEAGAGGIGGAVPRPLLDAIRHGTILRMSSMLYLHDVETRPVPPATFALPPTVLTRDGFARRVGWSEAPRN